MNKKKVGFVIVLTLSVGASEMVNNVLNAKNVEHYQPGLINPFQKGIVSFGSATGL